MRNLFNKANYSMDTAKDGKELTTSNLIKEISKLENENYLLNDEVHRQDELLFKITQENAILSDRVEELQGDIEMYKKIGEDIAVKNQLKDHYNERLLQSDLEKTTKEKNIYKETINKMCDKFGIGHGEVFKIIDSIKDKRNERER
ncbi:hypothetical protein AB2T63_12100 [Clostridium butyricum]|uniref:Uncharacterized protein n=1 Tax=Clostridium butyricum TaxID=1492 RepID=A0A2S7FD89_CLOBU|nr:hypothetical protein [Clostridium butyricum]KHD14956.1 hypothetical protein OA81_12705 [Clostridium butyricum]PPV16019.1 hypothetical protein AWN73_10735 [Clostridium butyricum]